MRLFIYGGTAYSVRKVIGEWRPFDQNVLAGVYGLAENAWSIGVGVFGADPFLILRQLQRDTGGRECSFALLFDPGKDYWANQFNWNPAFLAYQLLHENNPIHNDLFITPENLTVENLQKMLNGFPKANSEISDEINNKVSILRLLTIGTSFETKLLSVKSPEAGIDSLLTQEKIGQFSQMLDRMPPCFRCGNGWLLSGTRQLAQELGVKLLIDAGYQTTTDQDFETVKNKGKEILETWQKARKSENLEWMPNLVKEPVFNWTNVNMPDDLIERLALLAKIQEAKDVTGDDLYILQNQVENIAEDNFLLRELSVELAKKKVSSALTESETRKWVDRVFQYGGELLPEIIQQIDIKTYLDCLVERNLDPNDKSLPKPLEPRQRAIVWKRLVGNSRTPEEKIPNRLAAAYNDLEPFLNTDEHLQRELNEIAKVSIERTSSLKMWDNFRESAGIKKIAATFWALKAKQDLNIELPQKVIDYLRYGEDMGGEWFAQNSDTHSRFVKKLLNRIKENGEARVEAIQWLRAAALSPLRERLTRVDKMEIVSISELAESWSNFSKLKNLIDGNPEKVSQKAKDSELKYLNLELIDLIEGVKIELSDDNRRELKTLLGALPARLEKKEEVKKVAVKELKASDGNVVKEPESPQTQELKQLLEEVFLNLDVTDKFLSVVQGIREQEQVKLDLAKAVRNLFSDEQNNLKLAQDFSLKENSLWLELLDILPIELQIEILSFIDQQKPEEFYREAKETYDRRKASSKKENPIKIRGLWEYLLSPKGKNVITKLQTEDASARNYIENWRDKLQDNWQLQAGEKVPTDSLWQRFKSLVKNPFMKNESPIPLESEETTEKSEEN